MSDRHLTQLQREWEHSRSFDHEVAYLRARLRLGDLTRAALQLAADHGHMSARFVLSDPRIPVDEPDPREPWLPLKTVLEYGAFAGVSSFADFAWRFPGPFLLPRLNRLNWTRDLVPERPVLALPVDRPLTVGSGSPSTADLVVPPRPGRLSGLPRLHALVSASPSGVQVTHRSPEGVTRVCGQQLQVDETVTVPPDEGIEFGDLVCDAMDARALYTLSQRCT